MIADTSQSFFLLVIKIVRRQGKNFKGRHISVWLTRLNHLTSTETKNAEIVQVSKFKPLM